jgi:hypothetical protein
MKSCLLSVALDTLLVVLGLRYLFLKRSTVNSVKLPRICFKNIFKENQFSSANLNFNGKLNFDQVEVEIIV